jgi:hypothetical protein
VACKQLITPSRSELYMVPWDHAGLRGDRVKCRNVKLRVACSLTLRGQRLLPAIGDQEIEPERTEGPGDGESSR